MLFRHLLFPAGLMLSFVFSASSCAHRTSRVTDHFGDGTDSPSSVIEREPANYGHANALAAHPAPSAVFDWPVDSARMSRGFLPKKRRPHLGIDLAAPKGTPILASRGGMVIYRGHDFRGYGRMVMIESADGWATLYAHLDKFLVEEGQKVGMGEMIATMGRTGHATGVHLHFEIRRGKLPLDPLVYLPGGERLHKRSMVNRSPAASEQESGI